MNKLKLTAFVLAGLTTICTMSGCSKSEVPPNQETQSLTIESDDVVEPPKAPLPNHKPKSWPCLHDRRFDTVAYITACEVQTDHTCTPHGYCPSNSTAYPPIVVGGSTERKHYKPKSWPCLNAAGTEVAYITACEYSKDSKCTPRGNCPTGSTPKKPPVVLP